MIGGTIAATVSTDFMSRSATRDVDRRLDSAATVASEQIGGVLARSLGDAAALSQNPVLRSNESTPTEKLAEMKRVQTFYGTFEDITLVGLDGNVITSTDYKYYGEWDNDSLFQSAAHGNTAMADVAALTDSYTVVIHIASPVVDYNSNITSVLLAQINMEYIWQIIGRTKIEETGAVYLVNEYGNIIAGPDESQLFKKMGFANEDNGMPPQHQLIQYKDGDSAMCAVIAGVNPMVPWAGNKWSFVAIMPTAEAFATVHNVQVIFWIVILTLLVLFIVVGLVLGRITSDKIKTLARGTAEIAEGNLKHRLPSMQPKELGQLAESFNTMAKQLEVSTAEIARWNAHLKEEVEAKTKELERIMAGKVQSERLSAMGYIAASAAHELNDPLTAISGYAQLGIKEMEKEHTPEDTSKSMSNASNYFKQIAKELQRSKNIIRKLLSFVRYSKTADENIDVNQVVSDTLSIANHHIEINKVQLITDLQPDLPPVTGNVQKLQQVFLNMVLSAQRTMPQGGKLTVKTNLDIKDKKVKIVFSDTGGGISPEDIDKIFDPLPTVTNESQETRLDLSVSQDIIKQLGGEITVKSEIGAGTTFIILLPCSDISSAGNGANPAMKPQKASD
jgi:signal transduction histidine kinase